MPHGSGNS